MSTDSKRDNTNSQRYQIVFCVFLVILAFLYRDNPYLIYPQILYLFVALLSLNLAAGWSLKMWPSHPWVATTITLANCGVITAIVAYSGEQESNLWVLYLLPIYTSCLLLKGPQVVLTLIGIICFNGAFSAFSSDLGEPTTMFNLALKTGIYIFACGATWKLSQKDARARQRLMQQRNELEELEKQVHAEKAALSDTGQLTSVGEMASGIAHDLNNPITVILGAAQSLLEDRTLMGTLKSNLELIERAARLCQTIAENVLNMAKSKELDMGPCDIQAVLDSALQIYGPSLAQTSITVEREYSPNLPCVKASVVHFERVFLNLMSNARAAMSKGGVLRIKTRLSPPRHPRESACVQVLVEDTGPGLSPEALAKIFKPFNTTKSPTQGTGLGLYLSREIAIKHNGSLQVENRPEGGARFILTLPALIAQPTEHSRAA